MATLKTGFEEFKQTYPDGINQSSPEIASPSVEQNTGSFDTGTVGTGTVVPPAEQTTDFNIPATTEVSTKDLNVSTSDVMTARDQMESEAQKNLATLEGDRTTLQNQVLSSLQRLTGKSARQRELELQSGVEQDTADVKRLRTEIADIEAQMNQELQRRDLGITQRSILGEQSRIERRYLTEIGAKTAMMQALQGNIELAQTTAQRTVDMEFAPIEQEIQVKLQELAFKEGDLTRAEAKVQAEAQAQQDAIKAEKETRKAINDFAIKALENGASQDVAFAIMNSKSVEEAIFNSGSLLADVETDVVKLDNGRTLLINKQTGEILQDFGGIKTGEGYKPTGEYDDTVLSWVNGIRSGLYKPSDVPSELRNAVASAVNKVTPEIINQDIKKAESVVEAINKLEQLEGFSAAVGAGFKKTVVGAIPFVSGDALEGTARADFETYFDNMKSLLTVENLSLMKGVLSDRDIEILTNAAAPIKLGMTEKQFKVALADLKTKMQTRISEAQAKAETVNQEVAVNNEQAIEALVNFQDDAVLEQIRTIAPNAEPYEIVQLLRQKGYSI